MYINGVPLQLWGTAPQKVQKKSNHNWGISQLAGTLSSDLWYWPHLQDVTVLYRYGARPVYYSAIHPICSYLIPLMSLPLLTFSCTFGKQRNQPIQMVAKRSAPFVRNSLCLLNRPLLNFGRFKSCYKSGFMPYSLPSSRLHSMKIDPRRSIQIYCSSIFSASSPQSLQSRTLVSTNLPAN